MVGLPIGSIIEYVFAATNSMTRYGIGFIFPRLEKYRINGVNVKITISFEVKIVKNDINIYKTTNNLICDALYLLMKIDAIYEKNPVWSNAIDKIEIHINSTNIFRGFKLEFEKQIEKNSFLSNDGSKKIIIAPINGGR